MLAFKGKGVSVFYELTSILTIVALGDEGLRR